MGSACTAECAVHFLLLVVGFAVAWGMPLRTISEGCGEHSLDMPIVMCRLRRRNLASVFVGVVCVSYRQLTAVYLLVGEQRVDHHTAELPRFAFGKETHVARLPRLPDLHRLVRSNSVNGGNGADGHAFPFAHDHLIPTR